MLGMRSQMGYALHGGGARADDANALARQAGQVAFGVATGVVVVPAAGVEAVALERVDAGNPRQLGPVQRPVRHHHEARPHGVAAIGFDDPAQRLFVPVQRGDLGLEAGVAVQVVLLADGAGVGEDLRREAVLLFRHVAEFLDQRQIDVGLDVALRAGVAVPVPSAAEVAALLDDAQIAHAGFAQPRPSQQAAEAAADHDHVHLVGPRFALEARRHVGVVHEVGEAAGHFGVLVVAVVAQALVSFRTVSGAQGIWIEGQVLLQVGVAHGRSCGLVRKQAIVVHDARAVACRCRTLCIRQRAVGRGGQERHARGEG